jgi:hypothetical protein
MENLLGKLLVIVALCYLAFHVVVDFDVVSKLFIQ